jgi:hypothetical protein
MPSGQQRFAPGEIEAASIENRVAGGAGLANTTPDSAPGELVGVAASICIERVQHGGVAAGSPFLGIGLGMGTVSVV